MQQPKVYCEIEKRETSRPEWGNGQDCPSATVAKVDPAPWLLSVGKLDIRLDRGSNKSSKKMPSLISLTCGKQSQGAESEEESAAGV